MNRILALGRPEFVRIMQMGGAHARLADAIPQSVARAMMSKSGGPRLLLLERRSAALLRDRIRQVVGADLMEAKNRPGVA